MVHRPDDHLQFCLEFVEAFHCVAEGVQADTSALRQVAGQPVIKLQGHATEGAATQGVCAVPAYKLRSLSSFGQAGAEGPWLHVPATVA
jgi:hypothetical protein